ALASMGIASSASAATATADSRAEILESLTVTIQSGDDVLDFGSIALNGATGGTVSLTAADTTTRTCSPTLTCVDAPSTPNFDIDGSANRDVALSFTQSTITLQGPTPADTMSVALTSSATALTLDAAGAGTFDVGGTLTVGNGQAAGVYTGSLEVVV